MCGVAGHNQQLRSHCLQTKCALDQLRHRCFAVMQNRCGAVRDVGVAVHTDADVVLVLLCIGKANDFVHQIAGCKWSHAANDTNYWIHSSSSLSISPISKVSLILFFIL